MPIEKMNLNCSKLEMIAGGGPAAARPGAPGPSRAAFRLTISGRPSVAVRVTGTVRRSAAHRDRHGGTGTVTVTVTVAPG
jgi:hypothetical protein